MSKSRRSSRRGAVHIDLSDIYYDTTCVTILPGGLPLSIVCDVCKPKLDIFTKRSSQKSKKERQKHPLNRCKQYWSSKWGTGSATTTQGENLKHIFTRNYLSITQGVTIDNNSFKKEDLI